MSARSQASLEQTELLRKPGSAADSLWYKDAIIYELHLRAFYDSNGDGVGDLAGLIQKLDYLQDLGVTCVWLLPFFPSPLKDDGYDIADYLNIHPMYGTLADFRSFLDAAHERELQVIIELVMNHTSDQHPWRGTPRRGRPSATIPTRATANNQTRTRGLSSPTPKNRTGLGIRWRRHITGTGSFPISRI